MMLRQRIVSRLADFEAVPPPPPDTAVPMLRRERKFLLAPEALPALLTRLQPRFRVLAVADQRIQRYDTYYYDTANFLAYRQHHRGALPRRKWRVRHYRSNEHLMLEEKYKRGPDLTVKHRRPVATLPETLELPQGSLRRVLVNQFERISLESLEPGGPRITLDWNIQARLWQGATRIDYPVAVLEYKSPPGDRGATLRWLRGQTRLFPSPFSKYCLSLAQLQPQLPSGNFRPVLRRLTRIS